MHDNQLAISAELARTLIDRQFPRWRGLPVRPVPGAGTVNAVFRLGDRYAARFPLQAGKPGAVRRGLAAEAAAAAALAGRTRFATPEPVALGEPGDGYPLPWSVQTWLPGTVATEADPGGSVPFARDLAEFIAGVRSIPVGRRVFSGRGRGGPDLHVHDAWVQECFDRSEGLLDVPALRPIWDRLHDLPRGAAPDVMNHGDLIPGNVLVADGRLAGVLDVGGLAPADPALDLVSAWHLLEPGPRQALRAALGVGDLAWQRGQAWAFQQAIGLVWYYRDSNPAMAALGCRTLDRILAAQPARLPAAPPKQPMAPSRSRRNAASLARRVGAGYALPQASLKRPARGRFSR
jgi:aminoglycoside phosphotransferase (APT) family kinase protein